MKRTFIIAGAVIVIAFTALFIFNKLTSKRDEVSVFTEVKKGLFEITVTNAGELYAEKSVEIKGPEIGSGDDHGPGQGGGRQGPQQRGGDHMRVADFKIQDLVPEGTLVKEGDYIAQLDRTSYDNTLKDALENLKTLQANLEMKILDTAVTLTNLRDDIKNQTYVVEEAKITLQQSIYEPPATQRQAEISLNKAERSLEQLKKSYTLRRAQALRDIARQKQLLEDGTALVNSLQDFLSKFRITAPSPGIVIYKQEWNGSKRKTGSTVNAFDRIIATLPDLSSMISKTYVSEIEVSKVQPGLKVNINIDALPGKTFTGTVTSVANIGEQLPNSDAKMFEVLIQVDGSDTDLRPAMTTWNKIIIKSFNDVNYIPLECVQAGADSIPFVYKRNKTKQIVVLGDFNDKNVIVRQGLEAGTSIYVVPPAETSRFRVVGEDLIASIKDTE
ncbi:MAG: efflux RND transporter periplasmic adaptor subunit [Bacteroidales bacterium]|nr:efflux RND transporter periplasmic adaptor subunit [Bacteroidales bacterium]